MKSTEFRIGNLVLNDRCLNTIENLLSDGVCTLKTKQGNFIHARYELIEPVPLTEELLMKFGFKKFDHEPNSEEEKCTEYCIGKLSIVDWGRGFIMSNSFSFELRVKLEYVHQLQNLYFALTGVELQLSST